jgi:hypothetical protein
MATGQRRGSTLAEDVQGIVGELKARGAEVCIPPSLNMPFPNGAYVHGCACF